jgi:hypothetical protein
MGNKNLGFGDDGYDGDVGQVDLFGLDEFGQNPGADAIWGAAVGVGLSTGTSIALRALTKSPTIHRWSEGIGFLVGGGVSGAMAAMEKTRYAGWVGLMTSFLSNGLRQVETILFPNDTAELLALTKRKLDVAYGKLSDADKKTVDELKGAMPQLMAPVVEFAAPVIETAGYLSSAPPVNLMDNSHLGAGAENVQLMGGPEISGLGAHFGATLFG